MGLNDFSIELDSSWGGYYPGQVVSGKVACTFDSPKSVRGLTIKFRGRAETRWSETKSKRNGRASSRVRSIEYRGNEEYFQYEFYLLGSNNGGRIEIPAGTFSYPFTYTLPAVLPSSFEGAHGFIRYTIKATLDRPWKFDQETKRAFTVISQMDLNYIPKAKLPFRISMTKRFCCGCCMSGILAVDVGLPMSGYCSGETLPFEFLVENGSNVSINEIIIKLIKKVSFHSHFPKTKTRTIDVTIAKVKVEGIPSSSTKTFTKGFEIPPLPPSSLDNCTIINLDYQLKIICVAPGCRRNLVGSSPIIIGTVPLGYNPQQAEHHVGLPNAVSSDNPYLVSTFSKTQHTPQNVPYQPNTSFPPYPINSSQPPFANPYSPNPIQPPTSSYPNDGGKNSSEVLPPSYESVVGPNPVYPPATSTAPYPTNFPSAGGPYNSQMSDVKPPANSNPSAPLMDDTDLNQPPTIPSFPYPSAQPVYRESQFSAPSIHDEGDNPYTRISGNTGFAPSYPTYGFLSNVQLTPNLNINPK